MARLPNRSRKDPPRVINSPRIVQAIHRVYFELGRSDRCLATGRPPCNPDLREAINTSWKVDDERLAHIGDYLWAFSRCCGDEPERYLSPVCEAWATLSDRPTSEGETAARPAVSLHSLQWAFGRYPPMKAVAYLTRRGSDEDLRWPIMLLLQEIDDPEVLVFIVQELASRSRRYKDAESLPPYVDHVRDHWRRQQADSGRGMSIRISSATA